jgi:hypothetical protein
MAEQTYSERTTRDTEETAVVPVSEETTAKRNALLDTIDDLLEDIDEAFDTDEQKELDEAREHAAFKEKLKTINFMAKRAINPCLEAGIIRVPEHMAEALLSAGLATEHDCNDCD